MDIEEANEIYYELLRNSKTLDHDLVMEWRDKMPQEFAQKMMERKYGHHIYNKELYDKATNYLVNPDGSKGPYWGLETIKAKSGIDFDNKPYTCYDYAYVVNMLFSDYGDIVSDPSVYLRMAKAYLTDKDFYGDPSERAYHDACHRTKYFDK